MRLRLLELSWSLLLSSLDRLREESPAATCVAAWACGHGSLAGGGGSDRMRCFSAIASLRRAISSASDLRSMIIYNTINFDRRKRYTITFSSLLLLLSAGGISPCCFFFIFSNCARNASARAREEPDIRYCWRCVVFIFWTYTTFSSLRYTFTLTLTYLSMGICHSIESRRKPPERTAQSPPPSARRPLMQIQIAQLHESRAPTKFVYEVRKVDANSTIVYDSHCGTFNTCDEAEAYVQERAKPQNYAIIATQRSMIA